MGIFNRKSAAKPAATKKTTKAAKSAEEVLTPESQLKASEKPVAAAVAKGQAGQSYRLLISPRVSEKAAISASNNVYVFNVPVTAEKIEIARAVQDLYGVTVTDIRTARGIGKHLTRGRREGVRNRWKKAFVIVKKGQKIDLYEGV